MRLIIILSLLLGLIQCSNQENQNVSSIKESTIINVTDTASWQGIYNGTVPTNAGVAMDMKLILNPSNTYDLNITYLRKNPNDNETVNYSGKIKWGEDSITLVLKELDTISNKFRVKKNLVEYLNPDGTPNTSELAEFYQLKKKTQD